MKLKKRSIAIPLFFIKHGKVGGAEEMAYNLIEGLCVNSEVALFIHNEEDLSKNFLSFCRENKIKIFKQKKIFNRFFSELTFPLLHYKKSFSLLLHMNYFMTPFSYLMSKKVFTIIHDLQYLHFPENFSLIKRLWLFICHNVSMLFSTKVIAISDYVLNDIKEKYFYIPFKRIFRLYNSVDFSEVDLEENTISFKEPFLLCIAANYKHKNIKVLIRAFLNSNLSKSHKLVLVGQSSKKLVGSHVRDDNLSSTEDENIIFTGYISELEKKMYLKNCEIFCFPSLFEGFGMPIIEALSFKKPVLCSDIPVLREISLDSCTFIDDPKNVTSWIEAFNNLNLCKSKVLKDTDKLLAKYDKETIAKELLSEI
tara:strand:+ start:20987 stop:22087 length:1101 start_codon:yes stop_codon:yes gene_type:complete